MSNGGSEAGAGAGAQGGSGGTFPECWKHDLPPAPDGACADQIPLVKADAARFARVDESDVEVLFVAETEWDSRCLGIELPPTDGDCFPSAELVPGCLIIVGVGEGVFIYHTDLGMRLARENPWQCES